MTTTLSELQQDALGEIFNIGVGRAAAGLSLIVNDEVLLSAPRVQLVPTAEVHHTLLGKDYQSFSTVSQNFSGPFDAKAILIFPENNALTIVSHMLGDDIPPDELSEYEQEAMCEVGNIILNACLSALADIFKVSIEGGLPQHQFCDSQNIVIDGMSQDVVLVLQVDMSISQEHVEGHLLFVLSVNSLEGMISYLDAYLASQGLL